ncbi:MAG TPA: PEP-CTERM sorting domain-containing protein [Tepidisphaeraceae bacterium]|nr:PEP-CTERM sorting domain-containing protein [Tepidisphaeraceae bacterium]
MEFRMLSRRRAAAAVAASLLAVSAPLTARAAIVADFTDGNGTALPDQWTGVAGSGWATAWGSSGSAAGTGVVNTSPLDGGGNYLQFVDNTATTPAYIRRQYATSGDVNITQPYRISLRYRFDGTMGDFTAFNDRLAIFGDPGAVTSSATSNTWLVGVAGGNSGASASQSVFPGNWYMYDNNGSTDFATSNMVDTGLALVGGRVYGITVDVDPTTGTYDATIDDGVNPAFTASDLTFRRGAGASSASWFHVSGNATAATDNSAFSLDGVVISPVPEPSTAALLLIGAGLLGRRGRRR